MLQIGNIGATADLVPATGSTAKSRTSEKRAAKADTVNVSTEAQQAAQAFKLANDNPSSEIRKEVVEAARKRIEEGTYRLQGVVTLVASRLTRFV